MRMLMFIAILAGAVVGLAAEVGPTVKAAARRGDPSARLRFRERRVQEMGGWVTKPAAGKSILIVRVSKKVDVESLKKTASSIAGAISFSVDVKDGTSSDPRSYFTPETAAVVLVGEAGTQPCLLVAPEELWGTVNADALSSDSPSSDVFTARVQKEVWRAAALVLGAGDSQLQPCLMRQIRSLKELDAVPVTQPTPEPFNKMIRNARELGCVQRRRTVYKRACEEGWAPAPTNDVQKAIYEQVKADKERGPTNPLKIVPPKKP